MEKGQASKTSILLLLSFLSNGILRLPEWKHPIFKKRSLERKRTRRQTRWKRTKNHGRYSRNISYDRRKRQGALTTNNYPITSLLYLRQYLPTLPGPNVMKLFTSVISQSVAPWQAFPV